MDKIYILIHINSIIKLDFKDLFNNNILIALHAFINELLLEYFNLLNLPVNIDTDYYFKTLAKFPLFRNSIF